MQDASSPSSSAATYRIVLIHAMYSPPPQILFYTYALRLLWVEWEYFTALRLRFLSRGDEHGNKEDVSRDEGRAGYVKR